MAMTLLEKILSIHSKQDSVVPGEIVDIEIDIRVARDFGGANVVKNLRDFSLTVDNTKKTLFTFDCNPTGSDQKYAVNQGLLLLVHKEAVEAYRPGDQVNVNFDRGEISVGSARFMFEPLPEKLKQIIDQKGLVNYMKNI